MKTYIYKIAIMLLALIPVSCDRSGVWEELQKDIPWNFCVGVYSDDIRQAPVSGATVEIYLTSTERDQGANPYLSGTTDGKGEALFTLADFDKSNKGAEALKGNYYLKVSKGNIERTATTKYLLMNSGTTYHWIVDFK